jgi:hypothetical protein
VDLIHKGEIMAMLEFEDIVHKCIDLDQMEDDIIDWIQSTKNPEDVFKEKDLRDWALSFGFVETD